VAAHSSEQISAQPNGLVGRVRALKPRLRWTLVLLLSLVALVSLNRAVKLMHRLEPPPTLSRAQMEASLRVVHAGVEAPSSGATVAEADASALARLAVREPVFVTLYHRTGGAEVGVYVGRWAPTATEPSLRLAAALERAAAEARDEAIEAGVTQLGPLRVKVDLAGPARALWTLAPWYLGLVLDPGRDGLCAASGGRTRWFLPSWSVERERPPASAARSLVRELARASSGRTRLSRFRSTSFVDSPAKPDGAQTIVRGNVLPAGFGARELRSALVEAGRYMARMVQSDGTYCYEYSPTTDECLPGYNLLRHAGTTYSLYQVARATRESQLFQPAERATRWLRRQVRQVDGDPSRAFLLEGDKAKLGAAGLALIAMVEREKALSDGRDSALMKRLVNFIISQQRPDGSFDSYFGWNPRVEVPTRMSIYYPGEAILALIRHYGIEHDPRALGSARRGADYLVHRRWRWAGVELYVPPDAWLAQALSELDAIEPEDWLRDYAYEIAEVTEQAMLRGDEGTPADLAGAPGNGVDLPNVTAAGARTEGLSATWIMARRRGELRRARRLGALALVAARFQLSQQFRPENSYYLPSPDDALGGFRASPDNNAIRIDTVQHNVSGLLTILEVLEQKTR
jgi:hypothetical protein